MKRRREKQRERAWAFLRTRLHGIEDVRGGVTAGALAQSDQATAGYRTVFEAYGVDLADPDDLFVVLAATVNVRATIVGYMQVGRIDQATAVRAMEVIASLEVALSTLIPEDVAS